MATAAPNVATAKAPEQAAKPAPVEKPKLQDLWPDEASCLKEAQSREKGRRRAFKVELGGKTAYFVAANYSQAGEFAFEHFGGKMTEIGKAARTTKSVGVDGILSAVNALPEAERARVLEQLKGLMGGKK